MTREEAAMKLSMHLMQCGMLMPIEWVEKNGEGSELSEVFRMAIAALREPDHIREVTKKMEWISVEERLPEVGAVALVWDGTFRNVARFGKWGWHTEYLFGSKDGGMFVDGVTYWMPLPEPPEVEV